MIAVHDIRVLVKHRPAFYSRLKRQSLREGYRLQASGFRKKSPSIPLLQRGRPERNPFFARGKLSCSLLS
jgi:hypothetical protein